MSNAVFICDFSSGLDDNLKEREAFKAAAHKEGCVDFRRVGDGYSDRRTLRCWRIWQARSAIAANAPAVPDSCVPAGWVTLSADQWATIFNSNNAWYGYTKPEAIDEAVKMTESMLMRNNAASPHPQPLTRTLTTRELADVTAPWSNVWTDQSFGIANAAIAKFCEVNGIAASQPKD